MLNDGGAGFCRFLAWVKVKSNDVSLGHAIATLASSPHQGPPASPVPRPFPDYRGNRSAPVTR